MKYRFQVIRHSQYYPSSWLFETYEQALEKFEEESKQPSAMTEGILTICDILGYKVEDEEYLEEPFINW